MCGDPPSGSVAISALEHKAKLNGYLIEEPHSNSQGLQIILHLGETSEPKPRSIGGTQDERISLPTAAFLRAPLIAPQPA